MNGFSEFMRNNIRLLLGAAIAIFLLTLLITLVLNKKSASVIINNHTFRVTVVKSEKDKQIGLSKTKKINDSEGMLFLFDSPDYYSFWMKEMQFPIDIIYINRNKVTTVISSVPTPGMANGNLDSYQPQEKSDKVLEVNSGIAKKYGIKKGSEIRIKNL